MKPKDRNSVRERKRRIVQAKREREKPGKREDREWRKERRQCFWTFPWGHVYEEWSDIDTSLCSVCGKETWKRK
jgi:hypothetical protein